MAYYFISSYDVINKDKYENEYLPAVVPLLMKHGAQILVADYDPKTVEGQAKSANIVLKFEDETSAKAWYEDPDYEPVRQLRFDSTENGTALYANEFVLPSQ